MESVPAPNRLRVRMDGSVDRGKQEAEGRKVGQRRLDGRAVGDVGMCGRRRARATDSCLCRPKRLGERYAGEPMHELFTARKTRRIGREQTLPMTRVQCEECDQSHYDAEAVTCTTTFLPSDCCPHCPAHNWRR